MDGRRSVGEIRDALAASVGPVPLEEVGEYLDTLARLGVIEDRAKGKSMIRRKHLLLAAALACGGAALAQPRRAPPLRRGRRPTASRSSR